VPFRRRRDAPVRQFLRASRRKRGRPFSSTAADQAAIDEAVKQAQFDDPSTAADGGGAEDPFGGSRRSLPKLAPRLPDTPSLRTAQFPAVMQDAQVSSIDLLRDVELSVRSSWAQPDVC